MRLPKYDTQKLQDAFWGKKRFEGYTLQQLAADSGTALSTVQRVLEIGKGRDATVDAIALALGFKHGRKDVLLKRKDAA